MKKVEMEKVLRGAAGSGTACEFVARAQTLDEILQLAGQHAVEDHGLTVTPELVEAVKARVNEAGVPRGGGRRNRPPAAPDSLTEESTSYPLGSKPPSGFASPVRTLARTEPWDRGEQGRTARDHEPRSPAGRRVRTLPASVDGSGRGSVAGELAWPGNESPGHRVQSRHWDLSRCARASPSPACRHGARRSRRHRQSKGAFSCHRPRRRCGA
jgi:predicted small metal-binding protein